MYIYYIKNSPYESLTKLKLKFYVKGPVFGPQLPLFFLWGVTVQKIRRIEDVNARKLAQQLWMPCLKPWPHQL